MVASAASVAEPSRTHRGVLRRVAPSRDIDPLSDACCDVAKASLIVEPAGREPVRTRAFVRPSVRPLFRPYTSIRPFVRAGKIASPWLSFLAPRLRDRVLPLAKMRPRETHAPWKPLAVTISATNVRDHYDETKASKTSATMAATTGREGGEGTTTTATIIIGY